MKKVILEENQTKRNRQRMIRRMVLMGAGIIILAGVIVMTILQSPQINLLGDPVKIETRNHVATGTDPGPYQSNPPAGGKHYEETFTAGFYSLSDLAALPEYPEGYLVHNLEHGYIIFWYNCAEVEGDCTSLLNSIRTVMAESGKTKMIAFPWPTLETPLAMTSWGRILKFESPDENLMKQFVQANYNQAPEPNAD